MYREAVSVSFRQVCFFPFCSITDDADNYKVFFLLFQFVCLIKLILQFPLPPVFLFALICALVNPQEGNQNIWIYANDCKPAKSARKDWSILLHEPLYELRPQFSNWIHLCMNICQFLHVYALHFCHARVIPVKVLRSGIISSVYLPNIAVQPSSFWHIS